MANIGTRSAKFVVLEEDLEDGIPFKDPLILEAFLYLKGNAVQIHVMEPRNVHESDLAPFFQYGDQEYAQRDMDSNLDTPLTGLTSYWKFEDERLSSRPDNEKAHVAAYKQQILAWLLPLRDFVFSAYMEIGREVPDTAIQSIKELSALLGDKYSFLEMDNEYASEVEICFITTALLISKKMDQSALAQELKRHTALFALPERFIGTHLRVVADILDLSPIVVGEISVDFKNFLKNDCQQLGPDPSLVYRCKFSPGNEYGLPGGIFVVKTYKKTDYGSSYYDEQHNLRKLVPFGVGPDLIAIASNDYIEFVVLKYYSAGDLSSKVEDENLTWSEALKILKRVSYIIHVIQSFFEPKKWAYGDFKPQNFLIDDDRIIICDLESIREEGDEKTRFSAPYIEDVRVGWNWGEAKAHPKGDVYKIGKFIIKLVTVIPIEVPTGVNGNQMKYVLKLGEVVSDRYTRQSWEEIMHPKMISTGCGEKAAKDIMKLALKCLDPHLEKRPSTSKVVDALIAIEEQSNH